MDQLFLYYLFSTVECQLHKSRVMAALFVAYLSRAHRIWSGNQHKYTNKWASGQTKGNAQKLEGERNLFSLDKKANRILQLGNLICQANTFIEFWQQPKASTAIQKVQREVMFSLTWFGFDSSNTESKLRDLAVCLQEKSTDLESNSEKHPIKSVGLLFIPFPEEKCCLRNWHYLGESLGTSTLINTLDVKRKPLGLESIMWRCIQVGSRGFPDMVSKNSFLSCACMQSYPSGGGIYSSFPWISLNCALFWPIKCGRSDVAAMLGSPCKKPGSFCFPPGKPITKM